MISSDCQETGHTLCFQSLKHQILGSASSRSTVEMMLQFLWGAMTRSRILPSPVIHCIWLLLLQAILSPSWIFHRVMYFKHYRMRMYTMYAFLLMDCSSRHGLTPLKPDYFPELREHYWLRSKSG